MEWVQHGERLLHDSFRIDFQLLQQRRLVLESLSLVILVGIWLGIKCRCENVRSVLGWIWRVVAFAVMGSAVEGACWAVLVVVCRLIKGLEFWETTAMSWNFFLNHNLSVTEILGIVFEAVSKLLFVGWHFNCRLELSNHSNRKFIYEMTKFMHKNFSKQRNVFPRIKLCRRFSDLCNHQILMDLKLPKIPTEMFKRKHKTVINRDWFTVKYLSRRWKLLSCTPLPYPSNSEKNKRISLKWLLGKFADFSGEKCPESFTKHARQLPLSFSLVQCC